MANVLASSSLICRRALAPPPLFKSDCSNAVIEFVCAVNTKEKVVRETLNHLTMEISGSWLRSLLNYKDLQEVRPAGDDAPTMSRNLDGGKFRELNQNNTLLTMLS
ncbi:unnamed protein product [Eruca vesicaria subsp. sativa]|uniref:Uncharacterized protein n=1 Tax=Eruca vesicaria subsp. sativa TaxID=29727 RepID=A0ABC8KM30_ERUVS|nr:unnamed protein product [Eruca vesicaria subsp. sativa]